MFLNKILIKIIITMRLLVHNYLGKDRARLEYANTPSKPRFAPAYVISGQRADEFVQRYNEQSESLIKNSIFMTVAGFIIGSGMGLSSGAKKLVLALKSGAGAIVGLALGVAISHHEKRKLMNEYNVEEF